MSSARVRALIVDDEPLARAGLQRMLSEIEWIEVVGEAANGVEAARLLDALDPELVFLDVQMPGRSGLDVLREACSRPRVVFTTAFAEHAIAAFELGAIDYLLKPFGRERLAVALDRVRAAFGEPVAAAERLAEALAHGPMKRLFIRSGRAIVPLAVDRIVRIEASGDYAAVYAGGDPHLLHLSLDRLEERLDPTRFVRTHRAHLVSLDHVLMFVRRTDGNVEARMRDGVTVPVSRSRAQLIRQWSR